MCFCRLVGVEGQAFASQQYPTSDIGAENNSPNCFFNAPHPLRVRVPHHGKDKTANDKCRWLFFGRSGGTRLSHCGARSGAALNVHRTFIHSRAASCPSYRKRKKSTNRKGCRTSFGRSGGTRLSHCGARSGAALNVHRTFIHSRAASSPSYRKRKKSTNRKGC